MNPREIRNNINNIFLSSSYIHPVNTVPKVACDLGAVVDAVNEADFFVWDAVQNHVSAVIMKEMGRW